MGMSLHAVILKETVTYLNTAAKSLFSLPPGTIPLFAIVQVETAFNDSGTDTLALGIAGDDDYFAAGVNVATPGGQMVVFSHSPELALMTGVLAAYCGQNGDATTGRAVINLVYATPFEVH